jgi:hypothetical protein
MQFAADASSVDPQHRSEPERAKWECQRRPRQQRSKSTLRCRWSTAIDISDDSQPKHHLAQRALRKKSEEEIVRSTKGQGCRK